MNRTKSTPKDIIIDPAAKLLIEHLIVDCAHAIDDDDLEIWPEFFTDNALYKVITRENYEAGMALGILSCEGVGMMRDRIVALRTANVFEPHTYCHLLGPTRLDSDEGFYRARTNFSVIRTMQNGDSQRFAAGKYVDECTLDEGVAKFLSRVVVLDSRRIDTLLVIPL